MAKVHCWFMRYGCIGLADELIHLPDKPAGVWGRGVWGLADELIHLPDKPAGV